MVQSSVSTLMHFLRFGRLGSKKFFRSNSKVLVLGATDRYPIPFPKRKFELSYYKQVILWLFNFWKNKTLWVFVSLLIRKKGFVVQKQTFWKLKIKDFLKPGRHFFTFAETLSFFEGSDEILKHVPTTLKICKIKIGNFHTFQVVQNLCARQL